MKKLSSIFLIAFILVFSGCKLKNESYLLPFQDPKVPLDVRVNDLISRMTLEEKALQMQNAAPAIERLGIPQYDWWNECLHGVARAGEATVFPQAIGMAATFDEDLIYRVADAISTEARAKHHEALRKDDFSRYTGLTMWSPNINIFRDPRWGRGQETYGEDPYLTSRLGVAFVKGLQGDDPKYLKVVATPKHFAVHSGPEPLRHVFDAETNETDLYETYLPAFEATVKEGKAGSVMGAYNKYQGEPCCTNHFLLQETLRDKWGFKGYVVSDCNAIADLFETHKVVKTVEEAAALAVDRGCDLNCGTEYQHLLKAVNEGLITEKQINTSLKRLMEARFRLGMFDPDEDVKYAQIPYEKNLDPSHRALALETARKSMVLLKNENHLLPLEINKIKKIAVVGPNADNHDIIIGNYNGTPVNPVTILDGIRQKVEGKAEVIYKQGCNLVLEGAVMDQIIPESVLSHNGKAGLKAEYFNNISLDGTPLVTRIDREINSNWIQEPVNGLDMDKFSVRWTGKLTPAVSGTVTLGISGDDGFRMLIDGEKVIEDWTIHAVALRTHEMEVEAGKSYDITVEFFEAGGGEEVKMSWGYKQDSNPDTLSKSLADADVIIFAGGISPRLEGEEMLTDYDGFAGGDRTKIELPQVQTDLLRALKATGKPVIFLLASGSAVSINYAKENIPAILATWYPGESAGSAVADILFGDYNPSGRLPVTFYNKTSDLPPFEDYNMEGRTYRYFEKMPQFAFGYGLSYTNFRYGNLKLEAAQITASDSLNVTVTVTNSGDRDGEEVVQLYVKDIDSNISYRPIKSLEGVRRVFLKSGESREVTFLLTPRTLSLYNPDTKSYMVEPGTFIVMAGGSSRDADLVRATLKVK